MKKLMLVLSTVAMSFAISCGSEDGKQPVEKSKDRSSSANLTGQGDSSPQARSVRGTLNKRARN